MKKITSGRAFVDRRHYYTVDSELLHHLGVFQDHAARYACRPSTQYFLPARRSHTLPAAVRHS